MNLKDMVAQRVRSVDPWFQPWVLALVIGCLMLSAYAEVLFGSHSFFHRDFGLFTYPVAAYHRESFWQGEMPLWNPLSHCGLPFLAQWNTTVLYPGSLLYVLLPIPWSLNVFCLGHLLIAGLGMYFLALRWTGSQLGASVAGLAFAWNGLSVHSLMWTSNLAALAWIPWVVLSAERAWQEGGRRLMKTALLGGLQMLTGSPEIILLTWLIVGVFGLSEAAKRSIPWVPFLRRAAFVTILVAGLAAAQILPFLDLLVHSERGDSLDNNAWSMPPWGWANFLVPLFRCSPSILGVFSQDEQQWTSSYYVGIGTVALALLALARWRQPRVLLLGGVALAGAVLAMGDGTPVYEYTVKFVPGLEVMRYPVKFVVLTVFALPLMAAFGVASLQLSPASSGRSLMVLGALLLSLIVGILLVAKCYPHRDAPWPATALSGISRAGLLLLILGAGFLIRSRGGRIASVVLVVLIAIDLFTHTPKQNPTVPSRAFTVQGVREAVAARQGRSRAMVHPRNEVFLQQAAVPDPFLYTTGIRRALHLNANLPEAIPSTTGFFSLQLKESAQMHACLYDISKAYPEPLADFLCASQVSSPADMFKWETRPNFMPLITAGQKPRFLSRDETLLAIGAPEFEPRREVYLPPEIRHEIRATNSCVATVDLKQFSAHHLQADVVASDRALVVISQAFYHPWQAYVDGKKVPVWRANHAFQAIEVPAGHHSIHLRYKDWAFRIGSIISVSMLGCCCFAWRRAPRPEISPV